MSGELEHTARSMNDDEDQRLEALRRIRDPIRDAPAGYFER